MRVGDLSLESLAAELARDGVAIRWGPFVSRIVSRLPKLAAPIHLLYADFPIEPPGGICDFHVCLRPRPPRQAEFLIGGDRIHRPFHRRYALAMLEWGLNSCVYGYAHQFLIIHAAVVEHGGRALLLPGRPGVGKSTLCAALVAAGWRLLSDELVLIDPADGGIRPIGRPISLKNESIDIIREIVPDGIFGPPALDTHKGTVAHLRPPRESVRRADEPAWPRWIVMPEFTRDQPAKLAPVSKASGFLRLADSSFNYAILGATGFGAMARLVDACDCYDFRYSDLSEATEAMDNLCRATGPVQRRAAIFA